MSNHFHLHLKTSHPQSHSKPLQRLIGSYTKHFNQKYDRDGHLFSSRVKTVPVINTDQNIYLTKYIHTNTVKKTSQPSPAKLLNFKWSTLPTYLNKPNPIYPLPHLTIDPSFFCDPQPVLQHFPSSDHYMDFRLDDSTIPKHSLTPKILIDSSV